MMNEFPKELLKISSEDAAIAFVKGLKEDPLEPAETVLTIKIMLDIFYLRGLEDGKKEKEK